MSLEEEKAFNDEMAKRYEMEGFEGPFREVDMLAEWYCPHCHEGRVLQLSKDHQTLFCTQHYEICEYEYKTLAARKKTRCCYGRGYKYPITRRQYLEQERKRCSDRLFELAASVKMLKASIDEIDQELQG